MHQHFQHWAWFYDLKHLMSSVQFSFWSVTHDPLPTTKEEREEFDDFWIEEARLEAKGFRSMSLINFSPSEHARILKWCKKFGDDVFVGRVNEINEIVAFVGHAETRCTGLTMKPELFDRCTAYLRKFQPRPCIAVFEGIHDIPEEVEALLNGKNVVRFDGDLGTALSFETISQADYERIWEIAKAVSKPNRPGPKFSVRTGTTGTTMTQVTYGLVHQSNF